MALSSPLGGTATREWLARPSRENGAISGLPTDGRIDSLAHPLLERIVAAHGGIAGDELRSGVRHDGSAGRDFRSASRNSAAQRRMI